MVVEVKFTCNFDRASNKVHIDYSAFAKSYTLEDLFSNIFYDNFELRLLITFKMVRIGLDKG